ncbi:OmpH family outer membrane protein [Psychromonas antarctica]|jgi:outer membrane protein|uniref:OmpH family outer membrane protein n=1 Tax=Psychromonas antarctica TaxID=67573 RepID=UPI001EE884A7|nr:OmpH family outer membrane protein [Psychromonas antarctica]MCG6199676.1 OmpH family outer membrane protein [Psychromonas antarctica]
MKTLFKVVTLTVALVSLSTANAAQEAQKIGVVFPTKIIQQSPQREKTIKKLENEFKPRYEEIQGLEKEITKMQATLERDGEMMAQGDVTSLKRKIEVKLSEYKLKGKAFQEDQRRRQSEEQQKAFITLREVINAVALEEGYDVVLNGEQIVYSKPALDISDIVIKEISKK